MSEPKADSVAAVPCLSLLDVLRASLARGLSVQDSPDIKHLVELPMTEAEYKLFIQLTSNAELSGGEAVRSNGKAGLAGKFDKEAK